MLPTPLTPSNSSHEDRCNRKQAAYRHNRPLGLAVPLIRFRAKDQLDPIRPEYRYYENRCKKTGKGKIHGKKRFRPHATPSSSKPLYTLRNIQRDHEIRVIVNRSRVIAAVAALRRAVPMTAPTPLALACPGMSGGVRRGAQAGGPGQPFASLRITSL
jgi:hypothetical protein